MEPGKPYDYDSIDVAVLDFNVINTEDDVPVDSWFDQCLEQDDPAQAGIVDLESLADTSGGTSPGTTLGEQMDQPPLVSSLVSVPKHPDEENVTMHEGPVQNAQADVEDVTLGVSGICEVAVPSDQCLEQDDPAQAGIVDVESLADTSGGTSPGTTLGEQMDQPPLVSSLVSVPKHPDEENVTMHEGPVQNAQADVEDVTLGVSGICEVAVPSESEREANNVAKELPDIDHQIDTLLQPECSLSPDLPSDSTACLATAGEDQGFVGSEPEVGSIVEANIFGVQGLYDGTALKRGAIIRSKSTVPRRGNAFEHFARDRKQESLQSSVHSPPKKKMRKSTSLNSDKQLYKRALSASAYFSDMRKRQQSGDVRTCPIPFDLTTAQRASQHVAKESVEPYLKVDFAAELRKESAPLPARPRNVVPRPFRLSGSKRKCEEGSVRRKQFESIAEKVLAFHRRTPLRYRVRSHKDNLKGPLPLHNTGPQSLTLPHTPKLSTLARFRPPTCKSQSQLEEEELADLHKYQFKAQPIRPRLFQEPAIPPRICTLRKPHCEGVQVQTPQHKEHKETCRSVDPEEHPVLFRARPVPVKILEGVVGVPSRLAKPITVPESPALLLKHRQRLHRLEAEEPVTPAVNVPPRKPPSLESGGVPLQFEQYRRPTSLQPFSFDAREKERKAELDRRLEQKRQELEQVKQFHATPLPDLEHITLPEKVVKEPTKLEPFGLLAEERVAVRIQQHALDLQAEEVAMKARAEFKAQPCTVLKTSPFVPIKPERVLVAKENLQLHTEQRATHRKHYDDCMAEVRACQEAAVKERERQLEETEELLAKQNRKLTVHKANPIRHYKRVDIKSSKQTLTSPHSPDFN